MKVFLSWSGTLSHKVALVFREWLPSVIQALAPYVSSEDIDKGARWSTDIARELSDSTFGILCVTRDNINAPWLMFEAGALSKTMDKSFVSPFLFDMKRSEVDGPILQFQSTIFDREDLRKLLTTMNKALDADRLTDGQLNKTFDVWYPSLESELKKLIGVVSDETDVEHARGLQAPKTQEILEEVLELSRINQKLIRNSDGAFGSNLDEISRILRSLLSRLERFEDQTTMRRSRRFNHLMVHELLDLSGNQKFNFVSAHMALSLVRDEMPWVYDLGIEVINIMRSRCDRDEKQAALDQFHRMIEFSLEGSFLSEAPNDSKEKYFNLRKIFDIVTDSLEIYVRS